MDQPKQPATRPPRAISRRQLLKLSATLAGGAVLAACAQAPTATSAPTAAPAATLAPTAVPTVAPAAIQGTVTVMRNSGELTDEEMKPLLDQFPNLKLEYLDADATRFFAMYAAGSPPDLLRTQAPLIPQYIARKMLYDLTPYFNSSDKLKPADLAPANDYYKADGPTQIGSGKIYGMVKDWSPDHTLFAYRAAFDKAKVTVPGDTEHPTYAQVFDLAKKLTQFDGDRIATWGYGYGDWWIDRIWMNTLRQLDQNLYSDDFTKINLTGNEQAKQIAKYYFDLAQQKLAANPLNPSPTWNGEDFTKGTVALIQYGYWFSAMAESDVTKGQVVMLPSAVWEGGKVNDPTITGTGYVMAGASKVPDAAWKVFEWYMGGDPAVARAKSGWGVPGLKSLYPLMPTESDYQKQVQKVLSKELELNTSPLHFNPYLSVTAGDQTEAATSWAKNLELALKGEITFDQLVQNVEQEVNAAIQENKDRIG
jgi:multiple sugar transport system substrate-binding protein